MPQIRAKPKSTTSEQLQTDNTDLYDALDRLVRAYQFRDRRSKCYYELSLNECYALQLIIKEDGPTQNELAEALLLDKSTTSRLVANMIASGHIKRVADPDDRRAHRVHATAAGRKLYRRIHKDVLHRQREVIADLPHDARRAAIMVVQRLADMATHAFDNTGGTTQ